MKMHVPQHGHLGYSSMASSMKIFVPQHDHFGYSSMASSTIHPRKSMYRNMVTLDTHSWHHPGKTLYRNIVTLDNHPCIIHENPCTATWSLG